MRCVGPLLTRWEVYVFLHLLVRSDRIGDRHTINKSLCPSFFPLTTINHPLLSPIPHSPNDVIVQLDGMDASTATQAQVVNYVRPLLRAKMVLGVVQVGIVIVLLSAKTTSPSLF